MVLKFKNAHIFFAVGNIWDSINYKYRGVLNKLVAANPNDDFIQEFDIPQDILLQIFSSANVQPEGVAASTNKAMLNLLIPQLMQESNMDAVDNQPPSSDPMASRLSYNEAALILIEIGVISAANDTVLAAKLITGKAQILA